MAILFLVRHHLPVTPPLTYYFDAVRSGIRVFQVPHEGIGLLIMLEAGLLPEGVTGMIFFRRQITSGQRF
tara:strand:+ start:2200 stop:2409 length:210 start_codon:yes stop_codon:yes gene_type:complete